MRDVIVQILVDGSALVGTVCPFCLGHFQQDDAVVTCPVDSAVLHVDCWRANGNTCPTLGCIGRGEPILRVITEVEANEPATSERAPSRLRGTLTEGSQPAASSELTDRTSIEQTEGSNLSRVRGTLTRHKPKTQ